MYEKFFGLEDEPFRLTPDPHYLYLSPKHAEALAHLRLGLTESSGFVCITGDVGTGKTTLLRLFLSELGPNVAAAYAFVPPLSASDLLHKICREFGLSVTGVSPGDLVEALYAHLLAQHKAGRRCVIVLDEAQALSIELLEQIRLLLNFETEKQKLLCIVLVGQPQLRQLLLDPQLAQLNQRITLRWHLGALSYRETVKYVSHRLAVASGGRALQLFTRPALRLIHGVSGGVPRLVNMVAHRALLAAFIARQPRVNRRVVARVYREIQAVPLPGTLSPARKAAWAAAGLAIGVSLVVFAGPRLDGLLNVTVPPATSGAPPGAPPAQAPTSAGAVVDAPAPTEAVVAAAPPQAAHEPSPAVALQAAPATPAVAAPASSAAELTQRLASIDTQASARLATDALLTAWGQAPLAGDGSRLPDDFEAVASRRGLLALSLAGNQSMLRLLDLPALVEIHLPAADTPRYVALIGMDASQVVLFVDGQPRTFAANVLEQLWSGQTRVLWRDFDGLGPVLRRGAQGIQVERLQALLRGVGVMSEETTGVFGAATEDAVLNFQRTHLLNADGVVGPFTHIVLYAAAGGYPRPTLATRTHAAS